MSKIATTLQASPTQARRIQSPEDPRPSVLIVGSSAFHTFLRARLPKKGIFWLADPVTTKDDGIMAAYNEKPTVAVVDLDLQWHLNALSVADGIIAVSGDTQVIVVSPPNQHVYQALLQRLANSNLSFVRRRLTDSGERILAALESTASGERWLDAEVEGSLSLSHR